MHLFLFIFAISKGISSFPFLWFGTTSYFVLIKIFGMTISRTIHRDDFFFIGHYKIAFRSIRTFYKWKLNSFFFWKVLISSVARIIIRFWYQFLKFYLWLGKEDVPTFFLFFFFFNSRILRRSVLLYEFMWDVYSHWAWQRRHEINEKVTPLKRISCWLADTLQLQDRFFSFSRSDDPTRVWSILIQVDDLSVEISFKLPFSHFSFKTIINLGFWSSLR